MVLGCREQGAEEKHFRELGRKVIFLSGSREQRPPPRGEPHLYVYRNTIIILYYMYIIVALFISLDNDNKTVIFMRLVLFKM